MVIVLALNLLDSNRLLGDSKRTIEGNLPAVSFVGAICTISFPNSPTRPSKIASSISSVHLIRAFLCPAGVAVTLLRLVREVGKDIGNVDRREGVGRGGGSIATPR